MRNGPPPAEHPPSEPTPAPGAAPASLRPLFSSRFAALLATLGVAIGLGNFWRFPYLVGRFGGAAFVLFYVVCVVAIGIPALLAEWELGRSTRRGPVGAFERAGVPGGTWIGWFLFAVVAAATAYYSVAVAWVGAFALQQAGALVGARLDAAAILPPERGFELRTFALGALATAAVVGSAAWILLRGLREGIERVSRILVPLLAVAVLLAAGRALTLEGAGEGLHWYLLKVEWRDLADPAVLAAALGQAVFSLSLGGTFMVVYGSYVADDTDLRPNAFGHALGDAAAGLLAGLAIFPAVFALGLEPGSGPGLIFETLPRVFAGVPAGAVFGLLLFGALFVGAWLADVAALEVLVAGLVDNTRMSRRRAVLLSAALVLLLAVPPMTSMAVFVPWDLTFGSGVQTLGALLAVVAVGWWLSHPVPGDGGRRGETEGMEGVAAGDEAAGVAPVRRPRLSPLLAVWLRWVVPGAIGLVWLWWLLSEALGVVPGV